MKYMLVLADGMADWPIDSLGGKTPMQAAKKPHMDAMAHGGKVGLVTTVPDGFAPGSDVANLSMLGYPPQEFYSGRSSLEALCLGIDMGAADVTLRANLVAMSDEERFQDKTLLDYCGGEVSDADAAVLIADVAKALDSEDLQLHHSVAFRNILHWRQGQNTIKYAQAHDIMDQKVAEHLPRGEGADKMIDYMVKASAILRDHPYNVERRAKGLPEANALWLWGPGTTPKLSPFQERYGLKGGIVSGVDLVRGIGIGADMDILWLHSATGSVVTDFRGKGEIAAAYLKGGGQFVYVHVEAPDESGHQAKLDHKIAAIERIDGETIPALLRAMEDLGEDYRVMVAPDHPTPLAIRTHTNESVPFVIFDSRHHKLDGSVCHSEALAKERGLKFDSGRELLQAFLDPEFY